MLRVCWVPVLSSMLFAAAAGTAATVEVELRASAGSAGALDAVLYATPLVTRAGEGPHGKRVPVKAPDTISLSLPEGGAWRLRLEAEGYWSEPAVVTPAGGANPPVLLELHPTGWVAGRLKLPDKEEEPPEINLWFSSKRHKREKERELHGLTSCPVSSGAWRCRVPRGLFDLRLGLPEFVYQYVWAQQVKQGETLDLGPRTLVRGASMAGFVATEDDTPFSEKCTVSLTPKTLGVDDDKSRVREMTRTTGVNQYGFFHFEGIAPGGYVLKASHPGFADVTVEPVVIHSGEEASLPNYVTFQRPLTATFLLTPSVDVAGGSWRLQLWTAETVRKLIGSGETDSAGQWRQAGLAPGQYHIMIDDSSGTRAIGEGVSIDAENTEFHFDVATIWVEGEVKLGDEELRATLFFGGSRGPVSVRMRSGDDGKFSGYLPQEGEWDIDVRARSPQIFRRLHAVEVKPEGGVATVDIVLPDTSIEVEVVDESGKPVDRASVLLMAIPAVEKPSFGKTDEDGFYTVRGLDFSEYRLEAHASRPEGTLRSNAASVSISEKAPSASVRLTVVNNIRLRGRVVSELGTGIPGALIHVHIPVVDGLKGMIIPRTQTDHDGRFEVEVQRVVERVTADVLAPGFVLTTVELTVDTAQEQQVLLRQDGGGTVVVELGEPSGDTFSDQPTVDLKYEDRRGYSLGILAEWARMNGFSQPRHGFFSFPQMPAGSYEACWFVPSEKGGRRICEKGFLNRYETLELLLSKRRKKVPADRSE